MDNLKPCPFCDTPTTVTSQIGGSEWEPGKRKKAEHTYDHYIVCPGCGLSLGMHNAPRRYTGDDGKAQLIAAWNRRVEPANEPLMLEELREMDGEPVWIVEHPEWGHWELSENAEDYFTDRDEDFYGMTMPPSLPDPMGRYGLHMMGWLAYRYKPKEVPK